jgi:Zn ribbon nucleic-acid-binding protein
MSGSSGSAPCPKCGAEMQTYVDWKLFDCVSGECLECGFSCYTADEQMSLDEVNERRACYDLEPLEKLRDQRQGG